MEVAGIDDYLERDDLANEAMADSIIASLKRPSRLDEEQTPLQVPLPLTA